jgi:hypothetical protein
MNDVRDTEGRRGAALHWTMLICLAAALLLATPAMAQQEEGAMQDDGAMEEEAAVQEAAPAPQPPPCSGEELRQFDFWLGEWEVHRWGKERSEDPAINRISKILGGCALREEYTNAKQGYTGTSLNFYDPISKDWHQTWIDSGGQPLYLTGGWADGKMTLSDDPQDQRPKSRITWTPQDDGSVRQTWELSRDGGATWKTFFDGHYVRRGDG